MQPESSRDSSEQEAGDEEGEDQEEDDEPRDYYVAARSYGTQPETEPPRYVRTLSETGIAAFKDVDWLDVGFDYRMRFEYRDDDLRRPFPGPDFPFLLRNRTYLGIKEIIDPFRFAVEFEDPRRYNSQFPIDNRDFNENDFIQMYGELYFKDALGEDRPLRLQGGRMAFEFLDRRLIARNEWRNTTNTFQGVRGTLGKQENDWQLDVLAVQPVDLRPRSPDWVFSDRWFYGVIGNWRKWSDVVTLQPYYLFLDDKGSETRPHREIHTIAMRWYGIVGCTGFDYDFDYALQFGHRNGDSVRALGFTNEIGYTFDNDWKPRYSVFFGYASGDRHPADGRSERFDRLFGFARPWSANDYFIWENLIAPKTRLEFQPHEKLRVDMGYGAYWLASRTDFWVTSFRRSITGDAGDFVGQELDIRVRHRLTPRIDLTLGYAYFMPGVFVRKTGWSADTDFFYVETITRLFK